jgi:4'-phosphopantetheinyl transferase
MSIAADAVHAWHVHIDDVAADARLVATCLARLSPYEVERYDRYRLDSDRLMFLVGRAMARVLVGRAAGIAPMAWEWREGRHGRPEIGAPPTRVQFNLAHSAGLVVCALANGRDVGVDVEDFERRPVDRGLVQRYCSPAEVHDIEAAGDDWHDRFLHYWTLKEAYLKARGLGISVSLSDVSFTLGADAASGDGARVEFLDSLAGTDNRWWFHLCQPTDRHLVAVAASMADSVTPRVVVDPLPLDWLSA